MAKDITKNISQFTASLFPEFYREEGPMFIAFVQAYYEWMESQNETLYHARRLGEYRDVDRTIEDFIIYFKSKFLPNIQFNIASNKEQFIKNSLDFYRAKGTERAVDLFFKLIYGFEANVYYPGDDIFRLSDNTWTDVRYLEVEELDTNVQMVGVTVTGATTKSTAFVERLIRINKDGKYINVLHLSGLSGRFRTGEQVFTTELTNNVSVRVIGSLTTLTIQQSDEGFLVGETLSITDGSGKKAKIRVGETQNFTGIVNFTLLGGGWGFSEEAEVIGSRNVYEMIDFQTSNTSYFAMNDHFQQFTTLQQDLVEIYVGQAIANDDIHGEFLEDISEGIREANIVCYESNDANTANVVFEGRIVDFSTTDNILTLNYNGEVYDNVTFIESQTQIFLQANDEGYFAASNVEVCNATANVMGFATNATMTYEYTAIPAETSTNLLANGDVITQNCVINGVSQEFANAVVVLSEFDATLNKATVDITRDTGMFRTDLSFVRQSDNKEFTILDVSNTYVGIITPVETFHKGANTHNPTSGGHFEMGTIYGFAGGVEASFQIQEFTETQTLVDHYSANTTQFIEDIANVQIDSADYGLEGVGGYANTIEDVIAADGFENIAIGEFNQIFVTNPGEGYSIDPFFEVFEKKTYHLERYDFEIYYMAEDGDLDDEAEKNFQDLEVIEGVTSGMRARIVEHDRENKRIVATRLRVSQQYNTLSAPVSDFIGPDLDSPGEQRTGYETQRLSGELFTGQDSNVTARIRKVREMRRKPRSGLNGRVLSTAFNGNNIITAVELVDSGFGYRDGEVLNAQSDDDASKKAQVVGFLGFNGIGEGYYVNRKSFLSSDKYLHDNDFYQEYSYQVLTALPFNTYKDTLTKVLHVAGTKPFGSYVSTTEDQLSVGVETTSETFILRDDGIFVNQNIFFSPTVTSP